MNIVVPIKQVPATDNVRLDEETGTMVRQGIESIVNPADLHAVELALTLREQFGGQVTAISMGPPAASKALREVLAMGCDEAVLLCDGKFAGSDTWATSLVLHKGIAKLTPDWVICGERAIDGETGQVGPGIAAFQNWPIVTFVGTLDAQASSAGKLRLARRVEGGQQMLRVAAPAVLTVVREIAIPRLPTLTGKRAAREAQITTWTSDDLDVAVEDVGLKGSPTRVVKIHRPKLSRQCERLTATDHAAVDQAVAATIDLLRQREVLP
jgi:electron transfer flavoprotein beta subunit